MHWKLPVALIKPEASSKTVTRWETFLKSDPGAPVIYT